MALTPQWLDELRSRITLSTLIGRTVKVTRAGREYKACCPFHNEKTPSFTINDEKGFYHCFGCGAHGDAIRWMTDQRGLSFMDAVKELAAEAGMEVPAPDPRAAFLHALRLELSNKGDCDGPLWAEIEAASIRKPEIGAISRRMEDEVERYLVKVFALIVGVPEAEAATRFATHARFFVIVFKGVAMQPERDPALIDLTIATMDRMIDTMLAPALPFSPMSSAAE